MTYHLQTIVVPLLIMAFLAGLSLFAWQLAEHPEAAFWQPMYDFLNPEYIPGPWEPLSRLQMKLASIGSAAMIPLV